MSQADGRRGATREGGRIVARCIVLDAARRLMPGEMAWDADGRIQSLRRARGPCPDVCIVPGLVNAHAHLQLDALRHPPRAFVPWLTAVMASRAMATPAAQRRQVRASVATLLQEGVTAVGEIDSLGVSLDVLVASGITGRCYRELTGFHLAGAAARRLVRDRLATGRGAQRTGLSPHAPYSVSADLFRAAHAACRHLAIHCAETEEEQRFLRTGRGPFQDLLASMGRLPAGYRAPGTGAVRWLERLGLLAPNTQLVHCQELERGDAARIAAAGASIVVCPGTIVWFHREPPPVPRWLAAGIPVALGTDSRASSDGFSLRTELQLAARLWPELRTEQLLAMATSNGGAALGMPTLGRLRRGGRADFFLLPCGTAPQGVLDEFLRGRLAPTATFVAGIRAGTKTLRR